MPIGDVFLLHGLAAPHLMNRSRRLVRLAALMPMWRSMPRADTFPKATAMQAATSLAAAACVVRRLTDTLPLAARPLVMGVVGGPLPQAPQLAFLLLVLLRLMTPMASEQQELPYRR